MNKPVTIPYESLARWFHQEAGRRFDATPMPSWLSAARSSALDAFAGIKLPTRKTENWRYSSVAALAPLEHTVAAQTSSVSSTQVYTAAQKVYGGASSRVPAGLTTALELVFIDGCLQPPAWQHPAVRTTIFAEAEPQQQALILEALAFLPESQPFLLLNAARSDDGVLIQLNQSEAPLPPLVIRYVSSGLQAVSCPRVIVQAKRHCKAELIEVFCDLDGDQFGSQTGSAPQIQQTLNGLLNQVTQIRLEDSASLAHYTINCETLPLGHIGFLQVNQLGHSRYEHHAFAKGGVLKRRDIQVDLAAPAAETLLSGIYLLAGSQHTDFHTCINHLAPHCSSAETFRGIIGGSAKAVFNGRIHIYRDAQKSSAQLSNNNLLLTSTAEVNTKPELEIYADDVLCSHGATVGQLDKQALYYCQSRGISRAEAFQMLSHAFINELLSSLPNPLIGEWFQQLAEPFYKEAMP